MKKITQILMLFLGLSGIVKAQDFEPSQQAQGLLESKNVTVDYTTGIFHYKVPLYTLKSGDYELPISLDYTGKGVKMEDSAGPVGYNWTLNMGGVVTRTIRGGIADEDRLYGYVWKANEAKTPLKQDFININTHKRDGESDIFTVVLKNQSVHFIIRLNEQSEIYAEPLEKTGLRIECIPGNIKGIDGWIITDEQGNRYIYKQKEWTVDANKEDAISLNGVRNQSYVSSWYLNRIEPFQSNPIIFHYKEDVLEQGEQEHILNTRYSFSSYSDYTYGQAMVQRTFDFSQYSSVFDTYIREALSYLGHFSQEILVNTQMYNFKKIGLWVRNPEFEKRIGVAQTNERIMGVVSNFLKVKEASEPLIRTLKQLEDTYKNSSSANAQMASGCFAGARRCVAQCLEKVETITHNEVQNLTSYNIRSPFLESICCGDRKVCFQYSDMLTFQMKNVELRNLLDKRISGVTIIGWNDLSALSFLDTDSVETARMSFDYYTIPESRFSMMDAWGYRKEKSNREDERYDTNVDDYSKIASLKSITQVDGGKIVLDYEPNKVVYSHSQSAGDLCLDYGGIRLKSLVALHPNGGGNDTVRYTYPLGGRLVYDNFYNQEVLDYKTFRDVVRSSRMKFEGHAHVQTGNEGLFYPYVVETIVGTGSRGYLFYVPPRFPYSESYTIPYSNWLYGLPLSTAVYDKDGHLKQLLQNRYYTDFRFIPSTALPFAPPGSFAPGDSLISYNRSLPQMHPYEYYMNAISLSAYYRKQGNVVLSKTENIFMNPYAEVYQSNIAPRTNIVLPQQSYDLYYGGATLLKEQVEYHFESQVTDGISYTDFFDKAQGLPFKKTKYLYESKQTPTIPTRVIHTDSQGNTSEVVTRRVADMDETIDTVFTKMKQQNLQSAVIKTCQLRNGRLQKETVNRYVCQEVNGVSCIGLHKRMTYVPDNPVVYTLPEAENEWFRYGEANYVTEENYEYNSFRLPYVPNGVSARGNQSARCYDYQTLRTILEAENVESQAVAAVNQMPYKALLDGLSSAQDGSPYYDYSGRFYDICKQIDPLQLNASSQNYMQSEGHRCMMRIIEIFAMRNEGMSGSIDVSETDSLVTKLQENNHYLVGEFFSFYEGLFLQYGLNTGIKGVDIKALRQLFLRIDKGMFEYMSRVNIENDVLKHVPLQLTYIPDSKRFALYVLAKRAADNITCTISHSGGKTNKNYSIYNTFEYTVQRIEMDLTAYTDITSLRISIPAGVAYVAIVPVGVAFKASSYDINGHLFARFDQTCKLELYENDSFGRVTKVTNESAKVVKNNRYHTINH